MEITTVGELREFLKHYPDNKPIILDSAGNTYNIEIREWADGHEKDTNWPVAVFYTLD